VERFTGTGEVISTDDDEYLGIDRRQLVDRQRRTASFECGGQRRRVVTGSMGVLGELSGKTVGSVVDPANGVDEDTTIVVVAVHESIAADSSEDQSTERTRATTGHTKKSQSAERKSHGVDG